MKSDEPIIWVNDYALRSDWFAGGKPVYIFDRALMVEQYMGLKRLSMIHALAIELGCELLEGRAEELLAGAANVVTMASPCPYWSAAQARVAAVTDLIVIPQPGFIEPIKPPKLKRFMGFWKPLGPRAFDPDSWEPS